LKQAIVGNNDDYVSLGDYVLFRFDDETRRVDQQKFAYNLPLHIGQVVQVLSSRKVEVWWQYGTSWLRRWIPWRDPQSNAAYKEVMESKYILQDSFGQAAKLEFVRRKAGMMLTSKSQDLIEDVLATGDSSSMAEQ
jgi:hypothetical protein